MPRPRLIITVALLAASVAARPAAAQDTSLVAEDIYIGVQHPAKRNLGDAEVLRFFNRANCACSEPVVLYVALNDSGLAKLASLSATGLMDFWVGAGCDDVTAQGRCLHLGSHPVSELRDPGQVTFQSDARVLSAQPGTSGAFPTDGNPSCTSTVPQFTQGIYALIDADGDGSAEITAKRQVLIDLTPPPAPDSDGIAVETANEALLIRWPKLDTTLYPDLRGYQILCNRGGSLQVFKEGSFDPFYGSCPADVAAAGGGVAALDPLFVCSPLLSASTSSYRIKILQNDITYGAAVVAVDESGNASVPDIFYGAPGALPSFYDTYRVPPTDQPGPPGAAEGGFCAVAPSGQPAFGVAGLAAAAALLLARRRRARSRGAR